MEEFEKDQYNSSSYVWYNSPVKPSGPELLFAERLLITDSISFLVIGRSSYLFLLDSVLVGLYVSRKLSISSRLSNLLAYNCS